MRSIDNLRENFVVFHIRLSLERICHNFHFKSILTEKSPIFSEFQSISDIFEWFSAKTQRKHFFFTSGLALERICHTFYQFSPIFPSFLPEHICWKSYPSAKNGPFVPKPKRARRTPRQVSHIHFWCERRRELGVHVSRNQWLHRSTRCPLEWCCHGNFRIFGCRWIWEMRKIEFRKLYCKKKTAKILFKLEKWEMRAESCCKPKSSQDLKKSKNEKDYCRVQCQDEKSKKLSMERISYSTKFEILIRKWKFWA